MKRTVEITSRGIHLSTSQRALCLSQDRKPLARIPLEDLGTLILAGQGITVTSAALGALSASGCVTIVVGRDHAPEGALLPLRANTTRGERVRAQVGASKPLRKQLWSRVVAAKLCNQGALLQGAGRHQLEKLAGKVKSGDPDNLEAQGARAYWPLVFSEHNHLLTEAPFRRRQEGTWPNSYLNYGYAILRSVTARALCGAGLLPELGLHHHNRYDPFPLASDMMEAYRPWIDHCCRGLIPEGPGELDRRAKEALLGIQDDPVMLEGDRTPLQVALGRTTASLAACFLAAESGEPGPKAASHLILPAFLP